MSFPTFSGSSRRPRNVNMSGQKNLNPFAASAWTPAASSAASKTVASAQAERRQRQLERDKLKAAENIQRTWRGHKVRRNVKDKRRNELDVLYATDTSLSNIEQRSLQALPLVITALDPSRPDDQERLTRFVVDLEASGCALLKTADNSQTRKLARQLLALPRYGRACLSSIHCVANSSIARSPTRYPDPYSSPLSQYSKRDSRLPRTVWTACTQLWEFVAKMEIPRTYRV